MTDIDIETLILKNLYTFEEYSRAVLPFIKEDYFTDNDEKIIFTVIRDYILKYNKAPSRDVVLIELDNSNAVFDETITYFKNTFTDNERSRDKEWLVDQTENFCKDMALHNALKKSLSVASDKESGISKSAIPDILRDALAISFDNSVGHDYIQDVDRRFEFYHEELNKVAFSLETFNRITNGGLPNKSVMVLLGGTGTGKSLFLTHMATDFMMQGLQVLYITMEMSEEKIEERIDANLLDISIGELLGVNKERYYNAVKKKRTQTMGNIITKEYPTASAHAGHFRFLLNELKLKKEYTPDVVIVDYLNICASSRMKAGTDSYTLIKAVTEELRGLAQEFNLPILTATQTNRSGYRASDVELTDISESFGTAATADIVVAIIATDEFDELNQIGVKAVKNRYGIIGELYKMNIEKDKMRLYDYDIDPKQNRLATTSTPTPFQHKLEEKEKVQVAPIDISGYVEEVTPDTVEDYSDALNRLKVDKKTSKSDKFKSFNI